MNESERERKVETERKRKEGKEMKLMRREESLNCAVGVL
jgi:hypothetical protein